MESNCQYNKAFSCQYNAYKAACYGHVKCLQSLHANNYDLKTSIAGAVNGLQLKSLKYLYEKGICDNRTLVKKNIITTAILEASIFATESDAYLLECLKYLHEKGCPFDEKTIRAAIAARKFKCIKFLRENGCQWDVESWYRLIYDFDSNNGNCFKETIPILKYLVVNQCPWPLQTNDVDTLQKYQYHFRNNGECKEECKCKEECEEECENIVSIK